VNLEAEIKGRDISFERFLMSGALGLLLGVILFFEAKFIGDFFAGISVVSLIFGSAGFLSENLSRLKALIVFLLFTIFLLVASFQTFTVGLCDEGLLGVVKAEVKENIFTGDIKLNTYSGDPECADVLPWYYQDVSWETREREIQEYCSRNNESDYCIYQCQSGNNFLDCET
jgi:hypothetical protein